MAQARNGNEEKVFGSQGKEEKEDQFRKENVRTSLPATRTTGREGKFGATRGETPSHPTFPREISKQTIWLRKDKEGQN